MARFRSSGNNAWTIQVNGCADRTRVMTPKLRVRRGKSKSERQIPELPMISLTLLAYTMGLFNVGNSKQPRTVESLDRRAGVRSWERPAEDWTVPNLEDKAPKR